MKRNQYQTIRRRLTQEAIAVARQANQHIEDPEARATFKAMMKLLEVIETNDTRKLRALIGA